MTYTNDQRFQAIHPDGSDEWILKVSSAQPRDSGMYYQFNVWKYFFERNFLTGIYECQISTEPKLSLPFRLTVVGKSIWNFIVSDSQKTIKAKRFFYLGPFWRIFSSRKLWRTAAFFLQIFRSGSSAYFKFYSFSEWVLFCSIRYISISDNRTFN